MTTELENQLETLMEEEEYGYTRPRRGQIYEADILAITESDVIVDLGTKRDGIVPPKDLDFLEEEYIESLEVGKRVPVVVLKARTIDGELLVSLNKGLEQEDWLRAQDLCENEEVVEAEVTDLNRGGVLVSLGRLEGFVPNSHLTSIPRGLQGNRLREAKAKLVGQSLPLVVIEVNQPRGRLIFSERAAKRHQRQRVLQELSEGEVRTGIVRNLVDFGAFVDLGGVDGLIHISELAWSHIDHPRDILSVGDEVEVVVLNVDVERERIALSRKRLLPHPWQHVVENLEESQVVEGTVTGVVDFGVFVDLGKGVEGLIHTSEMPGGGSSPLDLESGSLVRVRVLDIDEEQRQIALRWEDMGDDGTKLDE